MRLSAYEWGERDRPAVLCLHGIRAYGRRFRKLAEECLAAEFRVIAVDLRGHGASSFDPPWNLATHLADVLDTADALGLESAVWIGHSFGGRLGLEAAAHAPERITGAILLDPAIQVSGSRAMAGADSERPERAYGSREEAIRERLESGFVRTSSRPFLEEEMDVHLVRSPDGRFRLRYCQAAAVTAWGECAGELPSAKPVPTLLIRAADSDLVTDDQIALLRSSLGDALEEIVVPGGHVVLWDAYQETADAIERFLPATKR